MKSRSSWLLSLALVLLIAAVAEACPNCKDALATDPGKQGLVRGIYYSILFMMSMPFLILGGLCSYFYYLVCRDRAEKARLAAEQGMSEPSDAVPGLEH
jgi:hypothetical protein